MPAMADLFARYREFVKANPALATELETVLRWISYFTAGRFGKSAVVAEFLYSSSSLLTLLNDLILRHAADVPVHLDRAVERLQSCLAVVEYVEVFAELAALHLRGDLARWVAVAIVQTLKACLRLVLLLYHRQGLQCSPSVAPFDRKLARGDPAAAQPCYELRHSRRPLRTLAAAPPVSRRQWRPPAAPLGAGVATASPKPLQGFELAAEVAHVVRPLAHLSAVGLCGRSSWTPWLMAAGLDVASLQVLSRTRATLQPRERLELSRRLLQLTLYLVRSPFYERISQRRISLALRALGDSVPLLGWITRPLADYIPEWQSTYCHNWAS
ncbi:peroxisomal membrane protein PEX16 [Dermacentor andersoni]|uniref:peroxisomal membrane protein PEX16 n=1 Tax=Dermacentor andersoni TaxID=34620 RepID=UPI002417153D|nr:peroxisomal membrane protein PEX16-like [Dermacentor andersoni]